MDQPKPCYWCKGTRRTLYYGTSYYAEERPCPECGDPDGPVLQTTIPTVYDNGLVAE